ncbi:MAG: ATP-binding cassette domain-containing protein [Acidobacteria bacterium]|nr:ATP-binding cassette domain-containing protein [Acidobacteriota bacterium]
MTEVNRSEPVIEFDRVALRFEKKIVLEDVSFVLERGETKIILGASGSGKSVLLKLSLGLLKPDSGRILVLGEEITRLDEGKLYPIRQKIGMVFQESALFDSLTVGENVGSVFEQTPEIPADEAERRVREALSFVGLERTFDLFPSELSGGMRRRVAIARAIVSRPEIVLYDSPTAGLDPVTATRIVTLLVRQRDVSQVSSLMVTHRVQDAWRMALSYYDPQQDRLLPANVDGNRRDTRTRFLVLRDGQIAFHGSLPELSKESNPYVQKFLA